MSYFVWVQATKTWVSVNKSMYERTSGVKFMAECPFEKQNSTIYIQKIYENMTEKQGKIICATCRYRNYDNSCDFMGTHDPLKCDPVGFCDKGEFKNVY